MKLKLAFITLLMTSSLLQVFGQERVNREKLSFDTTSGTLAKATGWAYNSTLGEWIDYENVISGIRDYKDKYKSLQGEWMMSKISQNFLKVQTKTVTYKGTKYYVLVVDKWSGRYKYPAIQEDWYTFNQTIGYIYTEQEYQKLQNIEGLKELKTQYMVTIETRYEKYDETTFLDLIQTVLSKEKSKDSREYTFPVMKSKEGAIRFYLPEYFSTWSKYDFEPEYFSTWSKYDFEKEYFETEFDSFSSIIIR